MWYHGDTITVMAMTLRTDAQLDEALSALAEAEGISRQEVVRRAVLERFDRTDLHRRLDRISDEMLERWGDVLDRLGNS